MKKVLIALDYNPTAQKVAESGYLLAKSLNAEVVLLHIVSDAVYYATADYSPIMGYDGFVDVSPDVLDTIDYIKESSLDYLDTIRKHLGDERIITIVEEGEADVTILETAKELHCDVIVMGSHSQKWLENVLIGSVAEKVLRRSNIPLLIIPTRKHK